VTTIENDDVSKLEESVISVNENTSNQNIPKRFAGFWMRFWAFLVDLVIIFSINSILLSPIKIMNEGMDVYISVWTLHGIMAAIVFYLYFLIMTKQFGQTMGKMIFGLQVIRADHEPLKWSDLIFREVIIRFVYKAFFFLNLLYLIVAFNKEKQGFHDMIGNTRVVHVE
jgi:uncharacterized RDD family membrane protein YckC